MAEYKLHYNAGFVIHYSNYPALEPAQYIPMDEGNSDYQAFLAWDAMPGNDPDPADPPPPLAQQDIDNKNALDAFKAAYPDMYTRLASIQTDMDGIETRANTLANMSTWAGLTLAQTTTRLQQVMPVLGQDISKMADDFHAVAVGLVNMLDAMKVFYHQAGGD